MSITVGEAATMTRDEIVQPARNAFAVSWLPSEDWERYLDSLEADAAHPD